jgi:hypothetical protein
MLATHWGEPKFVSIRTMAVPCVPHNQNFNQKLEVDMLSDKELKYLEDLEKNKDVIYLLNTRECELISRLIRSYKEIRRQLTAMQMTKS